MQQQLRSSMYLDSISTCVSGKSFDHAELLLAQASTASGQGQNSSACANAKCTEFWIRAGVRPQHEASLWSFKDGLEVDMQKATWKRPYSCRISQIDASSEFFAVIAVMFPFVQGLSSGDPICLRLSSAASWQSRISMGAGWEGTLTAASYEVHCWNTRSQRLFKRSQVLYVCRVREKRCSSKPRSLGS